MGITFKIQMYLLHLNSGLQSYGILLLLTNICIDHTGDDSW